MMSSVDRALRSSRTPRSGSVARQPRSSYWVSWRSSPWRCIPTAAWPIPVHESSRAAPTAHSC